MENKKKRFYLIGLLICIFQFTYNQPLPVKTNHAVIIDTDCAIDDLRAISLMLSRPEISIKAILVSDGTLPPAEGYHNVKALLHTFKCDTIPVGKGESTGTINPPWRSFAQSINWGNVSEPGPVPDALTLLKGILIASEEKIMLVCLGPLSNVHRLASENPSVISKIERIIWYNSSVQPLKGFNYECDSIAVRALFESGIRIDAISNLNKLEAFISKTFYIAIQVPENPLSAYLHFIHIQSVVLDKLNRQHLMFCDDLIPVYITNPELFDMNRLKNNLNVRYNQDYDIVSVKEAISDMIKGTFVMEKNIVFNEFPKKKEMFIYDVRQILDSALSKYGPEEWKAIVMTDEFHGHLGVFSIVGAKMGIKAREIFGVGPDMLEVTTFAGSRPPYSCLNDGIQVSTGATTGMGTIHVSADTNSRPSAIFTYKGRSVQLTLKSQYLRIVDDDINEGLLKFGLMDDGYWKLIRRNAIRYWNNWDRNLIFDIKEAD